MLGVAEVPLADQGRQIAGGADRLAIVVSESGRLATTDRRHQADDCAAGPRPLPARWSCAGEQGDLPVIRLARVGEQTGGRVGVGKANASLSKAVQVEASRAPCCRSTPDRTIQIVGQHETIFGHSAACRRPLVPTATHQAERQSGNEKKPGENSHCPVSVFYVA